MPNNSLIYKSLSVILLMAHSTGCVTRTEYGRRRLMHIGGHQNIVSPEAYGIIDTAKLYQIASAVAIFDGKPLNSVNQVYLKFYSNGRVGTFYSYSPGDVSTLNPKRADVGYYQYKEKHIEIKSFFEHPQGGGWVKEQIVKLHADTIQSSKDQILTKYKVLPLSPTFLVYKPDW